MREEGLSLMPGAHGQVRVKTSHLSWENQLTISLLIVLFFNTYCVEKKQLKCEQKPFFPTAGNQTYII